MMGILEQLNETKEELAKAQETIDKAIDYIENHSISKTDLLLHLQDINKVPENTPAVASFYYRFFKEGKQEEMEID